MGIIKGKLIVYNEKDTITVFIGFILIVHMKNFIKAALSLRNLMIFLLGGLAMIIFLLIVQIIISKSLEGFWDDDLIFPFLIGGAAALLRYEKPFFDK